MANEITVLSPQLALEVRRLVNEQLSGANERVSQHDRQKRTKFRMLYYARVTTEVTAADFSTPAAPIAGTGIVDLYRRNTDTQVMEKFSGDVTVYSMETSVVPVDEYRFARQDPFGDYWLTTESGSSNPRIRFITNEKINYRTVEVTVDWVEGAALHPITGAPLEVGDTLDVLDINNMWADIEEDSIGFAYYRAADETRGNSNQWEIMTCSQPISELEATASECLLRSSSTGEAEVALLNPFRSTHGDVVYPPDSDFAPPPTTITYQNNWKLDCVTDSKLKLKRITNKEEADPDGVGPNPGSNTTTLWELVQVEKFKARILKVTYSGATWVYEAHYKGEDPRPCGTPTIECDLGCQCIDDGESGYAFYDPNTDVYKVYSTASALLGSPEDIYVVDGGDSPGNGIVAKVGDCGFDYDSQPIKGWKCDQEPTSKSVDLDCAGGTGCTHQAITVMTDLDQVGTALRKYYKTVWVCTPSDVPYEDIVGTDCEEESS